MLDLLIFLSFIILVFLLAVFLFHRAWKKGTIFNSLNFVLLEVRFPKVVDVPDTDPKKKAKLAIMEQFYNSLKSILRKERGLFTPKPYLVFEVAVPEEGEEIGFYLAISKKFRKEQW